MSHNKRKPGPDELDVHAHTLTGMDARQVVILILYD